MTWRLIEDGPGSGARNMAVDEAIWSAVSQNQSPPTLRFYSWEPFCLSLGRLQKQGPPILHNLAAQDQSLCAFDLVRRPTGGRAVWHAHEITYSICMRLEELPPQNQSVHGAYQFLSAGLIRGLRTLGIDAQLARGGVSPSGANCFASSAASDFIARGKKLIGAAQCRNENALLQHGSLLLAIEAPVWREMAGEGIENAISLRDLGGQNLAPPEIRAALTQGFCLQIGTKIEKSSLSRREAEAARRLENTKYRNRAWNQDGIAPE